jgi:hypothetical protein
VQLFFLIVVGALAVPVWVTALDEMGVIGAHPPTVFHLAFGVAYVLRLPMLLLSLGALLMGLFSSPSKRWRVVCLILLFVSAVLANIYISAVVRV